ncbi:hypothetical protein [Coleofasciculus chthonoplastes]|uniref:hypothetical protein n=1 Tax=Coleofasciculus chthonoplastes TaxID=64178 RepID=UPI0040633BF4
MREFQSKILNHFRINKLEILILILLWFLSIALSSKVFNRPLGAHHEWLTGSTLTGLRSFENHGFWSLVGQLNRLPYSYEFFDIEPKNLPGWKPNHPSLFLVAPYLLYKLINIFGFKLEISASFIQSYNLIFTRLISTILIYFIIAKILDYIQDDSYTNKLLAFVGTFFWLFNPPILYWTQNVYHEDQAHLTPSLVLIYLTLIFRFDFRTNSKLVAIVQFTVSLWMCLSSYYGWLLVPFIFLLSMIKNTSKFKKTTIRKIMLEAKQKLFEQKFLFLGMITAIIIYLSQLILLGHILTPLKRFYHRAGVSTALEGKTPIFKILVRIWEHTTYYLPVGSSELRNLAFVGLIVFLFISVLIFWFTFKISINKKELIPALGLIIFTPFCYVIILNNYSSNHDFSVLKLALPLILLEIVFPLAILENKFKLIYKVKINKFRPFSIVILLMLSLAFILANVYPKFIEFAQPTELFGRDLGILVRNNIATNELPISEKIPVSISWKPTIQFYTNRLIYTLRPHPQYKSIEDLMTWTNTGKANLNNINSMQPVYLEYSDKIDNSPLNKICKGYWHSLRETVDQKRISICKSPMLKELITKSKH